MCLKKTPNRNQWPWEMYQQLNLTAPILTSFGYQVSVWVHNVGHVVFGVCACCTVMRVMQLKRQRKTGQGTDYEEFMQRSHDADCKWAGLWYLQPAQGPKAVQHLLMAEVGEIIATQIATGTDALWGSYCQFKGEQLGSKPHVPCLISYMRVSISWTSWNFSFPLCKVGLTLYPLTGCSMRIRQRKIYES